jgi:hypothetical protein
VLSWAAGMAGVTMILGGLWLDTADRSDRVSASLVADTGNILDQRVHVEEDDPGWRCDIDGDAVCGGAALPHQEADGFYFYDNRYGGEWMWCPAPMSGRDCDAPGTF